MICGPNGHGKTSLIEALLYLEVFRSFRGAADRELVRFGADGFRVEAAAGRTVAAGYDARTRQKKVTVAGVVPARLGEAIGVVRGVVLSPGDVVLVAGGPHERRRYLDVLLALTVRGYVESLTRYRRALAHRLRAGDAEMPAWEHLMAESGAAVVAARTAWAERWSDRYAEACARMGESGAPRLDYAPKTAGDAEALRAALEQSRERDRALGHVTAGPHRDELRLTLDGRPLRTYGSAGQQRTAALALRFLEVEAMRGAGGVLLCLDDAFAELDAERSHRLGELIAERATAGGQIVAAVPKESDVPGVLRSLPRWSVQAGMVTHG